MKDASDGSAASFMNYLPYAVGGFAFLFVILALLIRRRAKHRRDIAEKPTRELGSIMLHIPKKSRVFTDPGQYKNFSRVVAFHHLRYAETFLAVSDSRLLLLYDLLTIPRPLPWDIKSLRFLCTQFLRKDVQKDPGQFIERAVTFIEDAHVDVVLEELLDCYVPLMHKYNTLVRQEPTYQEVDDVTGVYGVAGMEPQDAFYAAIDDFMRDPVYLVPGTYADSSSPEDAVYSELLLQTAFYRSSSRNGPTYALGDGVDATQLHDYMVATAGSPHEYEMGDSMQDPLYDQGTASHTDPDGMEIGLNPMYDQAHFRGSPLNLDQFNGSNADVVYDVPEGRSRSDPVYEMGNGEDMYEPKYELSAVRTGAKEPIYNTGPIRSHRVETLYDVKTAKPRFSKKRVVALPPLQPMLPKHGSALRHSSSIFTLQEVATDFSPGKVQCRACSC